MEQSLTWGEMALCSRIAEAAIEAWKQERGDVPGDPDEAEQAVRRAFAGKRIACGKAAWKCLREYLSVIVEQIGFMVEE